MSFFLGWAWVVLFFSNVAYRAFWGNAGTYFKNRGFWPKNQRDRDFYGGELGVKRTIYAYSGDNSPDRYVL